MAGNDLGQGRLLPVLNQNVRVHEIRTQPFGQQYPHRAFAAARKTNKADHLLAGHIHILFTLGAVTTLSLPRTDPV